jgi:hypothetical protein
MKTTALLAAALLAFAPVGFSSDGYGGAAFAKSKACPPGLAKKNPPCVPPGLARKTVTTDPWRDRHRIGEVVGRDDLAFLDDYQLYDLPRLPFGQRYAVVDGRIVVIDSDSYRILQLIRIFTALVN